VSTQPDFTGKTVYLSDKITGDADFKRKFKEWEMHAFTLGARKVLNPATLPDGWDYDEYMEHCMIMVRRCDIVAVLPDWEDSKGARAEVAYALALGKPVKKLVGGDA
jgi:nucleoside 2-deoxyribosyltransferase